ncbi:MAG: DUF3604 domain-containing protein [Pseudomonadales bacterium]
MQSARRVALSFCLLIVVFAVAGGLWLKYHLTVAQGDVDEIAGFFNQPAVMPDFANSARQPCRENNPQRNPYFGALHIHTSYSFDSSSFGNISEPKDAYAFARGGKLALRLSNDAPDAVVPEIRLTTALDFAAVTDHAETIGEVSLCQNKTSGAYDSVLCEVYRGEITLPVGERMQPMVKLASMALLNKQRAARICGKDGMDCLAASALVWDKHQRAAEDAYDRSENCEFTSFVAYEYSLAEERSNLHRNVIFSGAAVPPAPLSSKNAQTPEQLWRWLKASCKESAAECDVISIPHNSNWSSGRMFYPYSLANGSEEEVRQVATLRSELEPLVEVMQVKGDSECRNGLSRVMGGADELCDFEKLREPNEEAEDCGDGFGSGGMSLAGCLSRFSFARYGLIQGLDEQNKIGINPFKYGLIAATDNHAGAGGAVGEANFSGSTGLDRTPEHRMAEPVVIPGVAKGNVSRYNPGGLAGVWAEENSRPSLFAAMKRKETFGTSGPRIVPRFFGGWNYPSNLCDQTSMIEQAYTNGVPMGGDLPKAPPTTTSPGFLVSAQSDTNATAASLQKIQIVKGWMDRDGNMQQRVYDVAGKPETKATVDTATCERSGQGFQQLCSVWHDKEFDPSLSAVYYARVVENPSCRWSTYDCNKMPAAERPATCSDPNLPKTIQERAWTSPIWYSPAA